MSPASLSSSAVAQGTYRRARAGGLAGLGASGLTLTASLGAHAALVAAVWWTAEQPPALHYIDVEGVFLEPLPPLGAEPIPHPVRIHERPAPLRAPAALARPKRLATSPALPATSQPPPAPSAAPAVDPAVPAAPVAAHVERPAEPAATSAPNVLLRSTAATPGAAVYAEGDVDHAPRLIGEPRPAYPPNALRRGAEGDVVLSLVVDATGVVREARITRKAGQGFDEAALAAAHHLSFRPGRKRGSAVPVSVTWICRFRLEE